VDVEDTDEVVDVFMDRLLEMEIEEGLPVYVIPIRPIERAVRASRPARMLNSHLFGGVLNPSS